MSHNGWVRTTRGSWVALTEARDSVDAGVDGSNFYLQTGGDTNTRTPVDSLIRRSLDPAQRPIPTGIFGLPA